MNRCTGALKLLNFQFSLSTSLFFLVPCPCLSLMPYTSGLGLVWSSQRGAVAWVSPPSGRGHGFGQVVRPGVGQGVALEHPPPWGPTQGRFWAGAGGLLSLRLGVTVPKASERGTKSEVAHVWVDWLHHPCRLGDAVRFEASKWGTKSKVLHMWTDWVHHPSRLGGPVRKASERGRKSEMAHMWVD